jgi:hypothetical protein
MPLGEIPMCMLVDSGSAGLIETTSNPCCAKADARKRSPATIGFMVIKSIRVDARKVHLK